MDEGACKKNKCTKRGKRKQTEKSIKNPCAALNEREDLEKNHFRECVLEVFQLEKRTHLHGKELFAYSVLVYAHPQEMIKVPPVWLRCFQPKFF
jgi:hypothetical protein